MRSFNFTDEKQLLELLPENLLKQVKELNNKVWDSGKDLLHLYDDFNDKQAGKRIIDYILKNEK